MADSSLMSGLAGGFFNQNPSLQGPLGGAQGQTITPQSATQPYQLDPGIGTGTPEMAANFQNLMANQNAVGATQPQSWQTGSYADFLNNLYQTNLGRAPEQAGFQYWQNALNQGMTPEQVTSQFQATPEATAFQQARAARQQANPFGIPANTALAQSTDPYVQAAQQTAIANLRGAQQAAAANRVNQITPYANLQYEQTGTDANGNPIWTARQTVAPTLQPGLSALQSRFAQTAGQEFNPQTPSVGINPGETYSDAIMRRLQPQLERQNAALEARLANQGIMPGSEAYNRAKTQQAQQQNDLLTAAQVGGINVGLQANQQAYNQALQRYNLPLTQLGAFQQATQPSYINAPAQAAVAGPDYLGAYTTSQAANIAAQNAAAARQANLTSGLFGLGSSAILSGGLPALGRGLAGLFSSTPSSSGFVGLDPSYAAQLGLYGGSGLDTAGAAGDVLSGLF